MSRDLETVVPAAPVFRLARAPDPWTWPDWSQASLGGTFGNRWDDPEGAYRVLYASSTRFGAPVSVSQRRIRHRWNDLEMVRNLSYNSDNQEGHAKGVMK